mmetsp:Transcript_58132/g.127543  ORF Transcript_58132/g.127543 Transcript_58132/m.127543 type:complete len:313 (+) Transcript_58132:109-1047(+)
MEEQHQKQGTGAMSVVAATLPLPAQSCLGALQDQITTTTATTTTTTATSPLPPRSRGRNDRQWRAKNATLTKRTPPPASQGQERECVESLSEPVADSIIEESLVRRGDEPAQGVELSMRAISDISLGDALDSFLAGSLGEVTEEFGDDWCTDSKLSTSVFDEDEILGDGGSSMLRQMISQTLAKLPCRKDAITAEVDKLNEQCQADDYEGPPVAAPLDDKELAVMDAMMKQRMISARENLNYARRLCYRGRLESCSSSSCPICLDAMSCRQMVWRLPCLHQVHAGCAEKTFGSRRTPLCPLCRHDIRRSTLG